MPGTGSMLDVSPVKKSVAVFMTFMNEPSLNVSPPSMLVWIVLTTVSPEGSKRPS